MRNGFFKSFAAVMLAVALTFSMATAAMANLMDKDGTEIIGSFEVEGTNTISPVIIKVVVPMNLIFGIDKYMTTYANETSAAELGKNQISSSKGYFLANKSNVPVLLAFTFTGTTAASTTEFVATTADLGVAGDTNATAAQLYLAVVGITTGSEFATAAQGLVATPAAPVAAATNPQLAGTDAQMVGFAPDGGGDEATSAEAEVAFLLGKAQYTDGEFTDFAANNRGVAGFSFFTNLNTYASWNAGDVTVKAVYTLVPLRLDDYATYASSYAQIENTMNQIPLSETPNWPTQRLDSETIGGDPGFTNANATYTGGTVIPTLTGTTTSSKMYTYSKAGVGSSNLSIPFNFDGKTITSVKIGTTTTFVANTDYTNTSGALVLTSARLQQMNVGAKVILIVVDGVTYTLNLTVAN